MGTVYINATEDDKLFKQLNYFSPPLLLLFFVRSGMAFQLDALFGSSASAAGVPLLAVGVLYFITRIAGKYAGAFLGCLAVRKRASVRNYLGLALIPQAGVAIGLPRSAQGRSAGRRGTRWKPSYWPPACCMSSLAPPAPNCRCTCPAPMSPASRMRPQTRAYRPPQSLNRFRSSTASDRYRKCCRSATRPCPKRKRRFWRQPKSS